MIPPPSFKRLQNLSTLFARRPPVGQTPSDVVHTENKWRLLRYRPRAAGVAFQTPVLLVPSLINRHYVLDLLPQKSLAAYLVAQGHDVYIIDWGRPGPEDRYVSFDDVCDKALGRALRVTARTAGAERAHVLGYCLGGTLAAIHAAVRPERVASLTLIAAPIRFHDDGLLATWTRSRAFDVAGVVDAFGNVPAPLMQAAFHLLRPTLALSKLVSLLDRAESDTFLEGFLALETWGSDNVDFPGRCFQEYLDGLYRADGLVNRTFHLSGQPVRLETVRCPLHAITFEHDNIVPPQSALAILELAGSDDKAHLHLPGGHVGSVVSQKAATHLWPRLSGFWAERDGAIRPVKTVKTVKKAARRSA